MRARAKEQRAKSKEQITVKATVTMPVSVTYNGDVEKSNDVAVRRNRLRHLNRLTCSMLIALCSVLYAFCLAGCGYTLHSRTALPFDSVQIERIENRTLEPKLQDRLHRALTEEFLKNGITVLPSADYKLSGTINRFELHVLSEKRGVAVEYEAVIKGDFRLKGPSGDTKDMKNIGSPFIVSFPGSGVLEDVLAFKELASEKAVKDIAMEIVGILIYPVRKGDF